VGRLFASPRFPLAAVAIGLLLTFCSVYNGLIADDYYHWAVLSGSRRFGEQLRGPQAMFRFFTGDPEHAQAWMDVGFLPWWTDPNIKAEFFQFIPTQTHILDYWLWPNRPELMHVHSLVWFALLIFLAAKFYRRILGPVWMAGVAALLFAVEDAHALPAGWIANRNSMIAASFGIGCLIAHDAWRREGKGWAFWLALVLCGAGLCSKEEGIATCAYLFAYALWMDDATLGKRFLTLVPYGLVLIVWRVVRDSLGFGVAHMGYYADPFTDPERFLLALADRYPVLLWGQWAVLSELWMFFRSMIWWIAVGYACFLGLLFWPMLRRDRTARFFATGMLLAVIPVCASFPMDRLLTFTGLGAFGLMVRFWNAVFAADGPRPRFVLWRVVAVPVALLLVLLHVVAAPVVLTVRASAPFGPRRVLDSMYPTVRFDETIERQDLVVVNPPGAGSAGICLLNYVHEGMPSPRAVRALAPGLEAVTLKRTDDRTLIVEPEGGYLKFFWDRLFRNEQYPLKAGDHVHLARMTATVLTIENDRPKVVAFRFEVPLEDASLRWVRFQAGEFVPWTPPPVGDAVTLGPEWEPELW
jgi:hypothetical protein